MAIDEAGFTKGLVRKLNALRKSVGDDLAEGVFARWLERGGCPTSQEQARSPWRWALVHGAAMV